MQVPVYDLNGKVVNQIEVSDAVFGVPFNEAVVHQVMVAQRANARQGTASTKTRSEVAGSSRKLFAQKHTGHARAGGIRSPLHRKGGIIFGPEPRDYRQATPKKVRRLALRCVLSAKVKDGEMKVLDQLQMEQPKTKEMARILASLEAETSALIVTAEAEENIIKSARNLAAVQTMPANLLNIVDIMAHKMLLITVPAIHKVEALWGGGGPQGESDAPVRDTTAPVNN
ncbi:MAG: 50S ribosomal protein L4 [Chloroflexota bacterium]